MRTSHKSAFLISALFHWQNFQPVAIRVIDKVNAHGFVFKTDAAHFFVFCMSGFKIFGYKRQMNFVIA